MTAAKMYDISGERKIAYLLFPLSKRYTIFLRVMHFEKSAKNPRFFSIYLRKPENLHELNQKTVSILARNMVVSRVSSVLLIVAVVVLTMMDRGLTAPGWGFPFLEGTVRLKIYEDQLLLLKCDISEIPLPERRA